MTTRRVALLLLATTLAACAGLPRGPGLYRRLFDQDSVLLVTVPARASF